MSTKKKGRFPKTLLIIWVCIFMSGIMTRVPGGGLLFLLALIYLIFMDRINERIATMFGKADKVSDIEYNAYLAAIDGYRETPTAYIAEQTGLSEEKVIRDLMRLMDRRYFPKAYFDDHGNFVVPSNTKKRYAASVEQEKAKVTCPYCGKKVPSDNRFCYYCGKSLEDVKELERIKAESLAKIEKVVGALPEDADRMTVERIGKLTEDIFEQYEETPEKIKEAAKFTEYYLPKTVAAVEYYGRLCKVPNLDSSEQEVKGQIEDSLRTIEEAFTNILHKLSVGGIDDLSTDVTALESVLEQDGLTNPDFEL